MIVMPRQYIVAIAVIVLGVASVHGQTSRGAAPRPAPAAPRPAAPTPAATQALTNQDILKMVQAGLGESIVVATIRTAPSTGFDLSPDALIALKKGGVSDAIVALMIDPRATPAAAPAPVAVPVIGGASADTRARVDSATAAPEIAREPGIYWDRGSDGVHNLMVLEPTVFSQAKSGGFLTSALTYGIKKINWKAVARGSAANLHIPEQQPTFYFYFESKGSGLGNSGGGFAGWLATATSPNEFVLARMTSKSRDRELIVGEWGAFGGSSGARSKDTIDIQIDRLSGGIYRVKPAQPLEPGEYCFFYAGGVSTIGFGPGAATGRLFDFGIYEAR